MDGQLARDWDGCFFYRTGECSPEGPRQPGLDLPCKAQVREGWSGYCQCADGRQTYHVGCENHAPFRCEDACRVPEDWCADAPVLKPCRWPPRVTHSGRSGFAGCAIRTFMTTASVTSAAEPPIRYATRHSGPCPKLSAPVSDSRRLAG